MNARQYYLSIKDDREGWSRSVPQSCMWCGSSFGRMDTHEIVRKSQASKSWGHRCNYLKIGGSLSSCNCHEKHFSTMPLARQLAVKWLNDRKHFDFEKWLEIRGRGDVEFIDVIREIQHLKAISLSLKKKGLAF